MVSAISFSWFADFGKMFTIIQWANQLVYSENKHTLTCLEFVLNNFFTTRRQKSESWSRS